MVKILGTGTTTEGQEYVAVSKVDFKKMQELEVLLDLFKKHGKVRLSELTGIDPYKIKQHPNGTCTHVPRKLKEPVIRALNKSLHPKGVTEEDENSFYKLRSDWLNVKL